MTDFKQEDFDRLKEEVESLVGRKINSPKDFDFLSRQIIGYMGESISISTLKRMWGYVSSSCKPSSYNLNLLSRMVGCADWNSFCHSEGEYASSRFFLKSKLMAAALDNGEKVKLSWFFGRVVTIVYLGNDTFKVEESINSKLSKGDTFTCHQFVTDEPLYLSNLHHVGMSSPCNYVCGQKGGIKWSLS